MGAIFRAAAQHDPDNTNFIAAGPWYHGQWESKAESIGLLPFGGHNTAVEFQEQIRRPFYRYYLHGEGSKPTWKANIFETSSNTWHTYAAWPPAESKTTFLYFHTDGTLSFSAPAVADEAYREYVSDPSSPVPYRQRPISPTYPGGDWPTW